MYILRGAAAMAAALLLASCALSRGDMLAPALDAGGLPGAHVVEGVPFFPQTRYHCGPAALSSLLVFSGVDTDPETLSPMIYIPGRRGTLAGEMAGAARRLGRMPYLLDGSLESLAGEIAGGRPVAVLLNLGAESFPRWHYAVVTGYDGKEGVLVLHSGTEKGKRLPAGRFMRAWKGSSFWSMVVVVPGEAPVTVRREPYFRQAAAFERVGAPQAAESVWKTALLIWPRSPLPLLGLGNTMAARELWEDAERSYRAFLRQVPESPEGLNNLAHVLSLRGCHDEALRAIEAARLHARDEESAATVTATRREILQRRDTAGSGPMCVP